MKQYIVSYGRNKTEINATSSKKAIEWFKKYYPMARFYYPDKLFINSKNQPNNKRQFYFDDEKI